MIEAMLTSSRQILGSIMLCLVLLCLSAPSVSAQATGCRPSDSKTESFLQNVMSAATGSSADKYVVEQRTLKGLPATDSAQVFLVADSTICTQARAAYATDVAHDPSTISVIVVRAASYYVVVDPNIMAGEWRLAKTFDSAFVKVKDFAW